MRSKEILDALVNYLSLPRKSELETVGYSRNVSDCPLFRALLANETPAEKIGGAGILWESGFVSWYDNSMIRNALDLSASMVLDRFVNCIDEANDHVYAVSAKAAQELLQNASVFG